MTIMEGINEAADSIRHNKLRTFLSLLGMIIGTASVVAVIASGAMMSHEFIDQADSVGARLIVVYNNWELSDYMARPIYMTNKDVEALRSKNPDALFVRTNSERYKISKGTVSEEGRIYGVDPYYWEMWPRDILAGRFLNQSDEDTLAKVCVLTEDYATQFFPRGDALGSEITIGRFDYTVVGVLKYPEKEALLSDGANRSTVFLSYSVLERTIDWTWFGSPKVFELMIRASSVDAVSSTARNIENYLNSTYGMVNDKCRFKIEVIESALKMIRTIFSAVTGVIAFIAGISLLVSGIGIMNVMLMAVTERTREIGIRKAIGARSSDIMSQFLIESLFLCLTGGIIGIILGIGITQIVSLVSKWQYVMPPQAIIIAVLVSASVGLFFGLTPAKSAAALDPVTAFSEGIMNIKYIASEALDSLASNMRKALLAALGLLVGVTAVVCVIAAGQGLKTIIMKEMGSYGRPTSLNINTNWRYLWETNYVDMPENITDEDIEDIKALSGLVRGASPLAEFQFRANYGSISNVTRLVCVSADYFPMQKLQLERGRMFNADDDAQKRRAAILGANLADKLFGKPGSLHYEDPIGKRITIASFGEVEVAGILKKEETSLFAGFSNYDQTNNGTLFVPYSTVTRFGGKNIAWNILAEAASEEVIEKAEKAILGVFARNHGYWGEGVNKFRVESGKSAIEEVSLMTGLVTTFIAVVAGLSLIVAGIGVMNVMLISVKERTREIGTRKALGARGSWIGQQFLLESLAVCLSGGLGGVVLAYIIAQIVSRVSQWPALVPPGALPLSLLLSVLVSLAFGFYRPEEQVNSIPVKRSGMSKSRAGKT